jgi:cobalt-zinc-cadmium efflux system outer membrane protein
VFHWNVWRHPRAAALCLVAVVAVAYPAPRAASAADKEPLTLEAALRHTRASNPVVATSRLSVRAASGRARDAGRRPNPELVGSAENFGGGRGGTLLETSVALSQRFEIGGDQSARAGLAATETVLARSEASRIDLDQAGVTLDRFLAAWSLQQRAVLLGLAVDHAREAVAAADERHRAGAAPEFERVRAQTYLATRELERSRAIAGLVVAKRRLALQWNGSVDDADSIALGEPDSTALAAPATFLERLVDHPAAASAEAAARASAWRLRAARGARVPDLTFAAGVRRLTEPGATAFTLEMSVPLPIWNAGGGAVMAAEAEREAAETMAAAVKAELVERLRTAHDDLRAAWSAHRAARDAVGPGAEEALRLMRDSYRAGRLGYVDILEGQRSVLDANLLIVETHAEVWRARANFDQLTGGPLALTEDR